MIQYMYVLWNDDHNKVHKYVHHLEKDNYIYSNRKDSMKKLGKKPF